MSAFTRMTVSVILTGLALILIVEGWHRGTAGLRRMLRALRDQARLDWLARSEADVRREVGGIWTVGLPGRHATTLGTGLTVRQALDDAMEAQRQLRARARALVHDLRRTESVR